MLLRRRQTNNDKRRQGVPVVSLAVGYALAAALLVSAGSASASDPPKPAHEVGSDRHPINSLPADVQALRERVPSSLFPAITETLQLNGSYEVYRAVQDTSGEHTYRLKNPQHSLAAELGSGGVSISSAESAEWTWSLKFDGYGRGTLLDHVAAPSLTAEGNRVEYQYPAGVTEWYVNGPLGLQQGFTFESKPSPQIEGPLVVRQTMSGDVTVEVNGNGTSALLRSQESPNALKYGGLYAYDASGVELGVRLQATSSGLSILVDDAGAQYPITIDPFIGKVLLAGTADDPREGFGVSVSISGDTVVVGATNFSYGVHGAVYLFTLPDGEQTAAPEAIVLKSPRAEPGDSFGNSVSISDDTIVVGAPWERDEELHEWRRFGAAYVFTKPSGGWVSTSDAARLTAPDDASVTWFGTSVAVSGDTVVVGAPGHRYRPWEETSRAAYVFTKPNDGWSDTSEAVELTAPDGSRNDQFGHSVAVSGDTVVVGAYLADLNDDEEDFGAAYVFTKPSGGWEDTSDSVRLTAPDGAEGREFGRSVSVSGDTLVIGAPYSGRYTGFEIYREAREAEDKTPYLGSVYVYGTASADWTDSQSPVKLTAPDGFPWTRFGWSVSVNGDAIAVGETESRHATQPGEYAYIQGGAAYVFSKPPQGWSSAAERRELSVPNPMRYDSYGSSVFVNGDIAVVGAPRDGNENGPYAGSAYLFRMPADGWTSDTPLSDPVMLKAHDGPAGDRFGHSVAVDGDLLVVGVPGDHDRVLGSAYLFVRQNTEWDHGRIRLEASDATPGGRFGTSVAVDQDTIVVGAPGTEDGDDPGAVYVFVTPDGGLERTYSLAYAAKLRIPDAGADARFGHSVATSGDTIVVGAPGEGAVYVYTKPDTGWAQVSAPAKLISPGDTVGRRFGHAVSITGDTIVVGAPEGNGAGVAYVFTKPDAGWTNTSVAAELTASDAATGERFGYAVSASGSTVLVGAPGSESGDDAGASYVFTNPETGWSNTSAAAKLTAADGAAGDWFGHSVSVSDALIVVGAHGEEENSGAVYAFRRPHDGWAASSDAQKLTAKEAAMGDAFGYAVSVDGDTLAVGLPNDVVSDRQNYLRGAHSGTARIFTWPGLLWVDTPAAFKIVPPNAESSRIFGVSLSADGNTAVVGTVQAVDTATSSVGTAKAFVYTRRDGEWDTSTPATLTLPEGGTFSQHGLAVSKNGDTVVVGFTPAASASDTTPQPNSVLVFTRPDGGWASTSIAARLTMPDGESEGSFGQTVSVSGDTIVVGAYGDDSYYGTSYKGSAFVFTRPDGGWVSTSVAAKLTAPAGDPGDEFGRAVAVSGDTVVIAAPGDRDIQGSRAGSAYVFTRPAEGWVSTFESARLTAPDGWSVYWSRNDFGSSVAVKGDKIVIGAPSYWDVNSAVYVFSKPPGGWDNPYIVSKLTSPGLASYSYFGASVSMSDDAIFVGAPGGMYADSSGQVFVFPIPTDTGVFTGAPVRLSDPHGGTLDAFGGAVSAGGNRVAAGALLSDDHGEDFGAVYIFSEPPDGWSYSTGPMGHTAALVSPDWNPGHLFGHSISPTADAVMVGAPNSYRVSDPGAAYVFTGPFNSLFSRDDAARLSPPGGDAGRSFGWSVSLTSDAMAVGSPDLTSGTGAAYVFTKPDEGWVSTSDAAKLTSPRDGPDRNFGYSVSLSGETVVVGAIRDDEAGSAYLFTKPRSDTWQSTSDAIEVKAPEGEGLSTFGWSVAITDDTLAVGMPSREGLGAVYVFSKPTGGWVSVPAPVKLTPADGRNGDMFGASVAVSGDTVVVGASGTGSYDLPGAAYVFTKPATGWVSTEEEAKLTPETGESSDWFGTSVAVDGDTVVVGGQNYNGYHQTNDAYVFSKPPGGWVSASAPPITVYANWYGYSDDRLGVSVGVAGDSVFVGTPSGTGIGTVYVYEDFFDE